MHDIPSSEASKAFDKMCTWRTWSGSLAPYHCQFHVLYPDLDEQKVDAARHNIRQMVARSVVLKLNVQAILDADLELD